MKKPLPIGIFDFKVKVKEFYYIDKSFLIKNLINQGEGIVHLFTRPRGFGKSLFQSMI